MKANTTRSTLIASLLIISASFFSSQGFAAHHGEKKAKKDIIDTADMPTCGFDRSWFNRHFKR